MTRFSPSFPRLYCTAAAVLAVLLALPGCDGRDAKLLRVTGTIEAVTVQAGSRVGGRVAEAPAAEGQRVAKGAVLVRLDDAEALARLAAAKGAAAQAAAMLDKARRGATEAQLRQAEAAAEAARQQYAMAQEGARAQEVRAAAAAAAGARAQRDAAQADRDRMQALIADGAVTQRQVDQARAAFEAAEAQWAAAREKESALVEGLRDEEIATAKANFDRAQAALDDLRTGTRAEDLAAAAAAAASAEAQVQLAEVNLAEMTIVAPMDGVVESLDVHPGDIVRPGPLVRMLNPDDLELRVYVSAALLGGLQPGQTLEFETDAHGAERFRGSIRQIASEGEFTPRNLQTQEERVQQVFAVTLALDSAGGRLRPGITATVHIPRGDGAR